VGHAALLLRTLRVVGKPRPTVLKNDAWASAAKAKAAGIYKGRPASIDAARVRELKAQGLGATQIAKDLNIGRASVYRALEGAK